MKDKWYLLHDCPVVTIHTPDIQIYIHVVQHPKMGKVVNKIHPDHGWAWVILLAGFFCSVTFDGIVFSFGIFYLEFLDYFRAGRSLTSVIGSVIGGVYAIIGKYEGDGYDE